MPTITCARCKQVKEQLPSPPMGGTLGSRVHATICVDCWEEWRTLSARIINHYGLNLGVPEHRAHLREAMKEFLELTGV